MSKSLWKKLGDRDLFAKDYCCWWDNHGGGAKYKKEQRQKARKKMKNILNKEIDLHL